MTRLIVAFGGHLNSGKSTASDHLVARHGFARTSPIDPFKRAAVELGWPEYAAFGPSSAREMPHPYLTKPDGSPLILREWLDDISATARAKCPTILLAASMRGGGDVVNESCRKRIEYDAIRAAGGRVIKRKGGTRRGDEYDEVGDMPDGAFDAVIPEGLTLGQLHAMLDVLVSGWRSELGR